MAELANLDEVGVAFHTALRREGCSEHAYAAWEAIRDMDGDEWGRIVSLVIESLRTPSAEQPS